MWLALVSPEFLTAVVMIVLLIGMPLFVIAVTAVVSAYIQYDAEQRLEELEETDGNRPPDPIEESDR
ncbi:hypothetical protein GS429_00965 [Natronorubrum sp. JWXQ-INN-674]|uniref:Uncharacterized protein n=1 Tax=Natronorubrum halalkaliphilum TaxID=2691917 RepID=A0A6B0VIM9_9EURY|nr:hypothetical protein [Natronorubrum halalkaliphilum]MXV60662.1 hypothetical protein [Natronorubrum halalkaliphilum]